MSYIAYPRLPSSDPAAGSISAITASLRPSSDVPSLSLSMSMSSGIRHPRSPVAFDAAQNVNVVAQTSSGVVIDASVMMLRTRTRTRTRKNQRRTGTSHRPLWALILSLSSRMCEPSESASAACTRRGCMAHRRRLGGACAARRGGCRIECCELSSALCMRTGSRLSSCRHPVKPQSGSWCPWG
ncbi:hypothetical protein OH76DRAFT_280590 [Lentinus brumalis]|uniref:Uncharacterized protein n=1 Tax=Lentinus brumalis TaxID=2498619 RepID=A0A371CKX0_9APHY|nr:hypothetical protein OH76DRAFT_280590 [Polyporus brumalis]